MLSIVAAVGVVLVRLLLAGAASSPDIFLRLGGFFLLRRRGVARMHDVGLVALNNADGHHRDGDEGGEAHDHPGDVAQVDAVVGVDLCAASAAAVVFIRLVAVVVGRAGERGRLLCGRGDRSLSNGWLSSWDRGWWLRNGWLGGLDWR